MSLGKIGYKYMQDEIDKLKEENEKMREALSEIANGHLHENISESVAKESLNSLGENRNNNTEKK